MEVNISQLLIILAILVAVTDIIVQIIKPITEALIHTNWLALIVAMLVTFLAGAAYAGYYEIEVTTYMIIATFFAGFIVAFAAMFGFDKLKQTFTDKIKQATGEQQ